MKRILFLAVGISLLVGLSGCGSPPKFKGAKAVKTSVEATVSSVVSGTVKAEKVAELAFGAVGRVKKQSVRLGDKVKKDQILAELENDDLYTAMVVAKTETERREKLFKANSTSSLELEKAEVAYDFARINYEKSLIRAPYDGSIVEVNLELGQLSQITAVVPKPLIRIVDVEPRYIRAEIDEVDLPRVKEGMPARVKILAIRREPFKATIRRVVPWVSMVREQDRTSEIELNIENEGMLLPAGASADVEVVVEKVEDVLAVPSRCVMGRGDRRYVYKYSSDGLAVKSAVKTGLANYDRTQILDGVAEGDILLYPSESAELADNLKVELDLQPWP